MIQNLKISKRKLAARLNVDHAVITRLTAILDLPRVIREALDNRLRMIKSRQGERITLNVESVEDFGEN